jgi:hypothetical protein
MAGWPVAFGPVARQHSAAGAQGRAKTAHIMSRKQKDRVWGPPVPFKGTPW